MKDQPTLSIETAADGDVVWIKLDGPVNENSRLTERAPDVSNHAVIIDLGEVTRFNSLGTREWIRWLTRLEKQGNRLYFERCAPSAVAQLGSVHNFTGDKGLVLSFLAPYFCPNCNAERFEMVLVESLTTAAPPAALCNACGEPLDYDGVVEFDFRWVNNHMGRPIEQSVRDSFTRMRGRSVATTLAALKELATTGLARTPSRPGGSRPPRAGTQEPTGEHPTERASRPGGSKVKK